MKGVVIVVLAGIVSTAPALAADVVSGPAPDPETELTGVAAGKDAQDRGASSLAPLIGTAAGLLALGAAVANATGSSEASTTTTTPSTSAR